LFEEQQTFFPTEKEMAKTFPARTRKCEWAKIKKVRWEKGSHGAEKAHLRLLFAV